MHSCQNNPEKSYTEKKTKHERLLVTHYLQIVHLMQQKTSLISYRGKDCMENFCKDLREHKMRIVKFIKEKK